MKYYYYSTITAIITAVLTSDINYTEIFYAEPRVLVTDAEPRLLFSEKTSSSRAETLAKRSLVELRLLQNISEPKRCFFKVTF